MSAEQEFEKWWNEHGSPSVGHRPEYKKALLAAFARGRKSGLEEAAGVAEHERLTDAAGLNILEKLQYNIAIKDIAAAIRQRVEEGRKDTSQIVQEERECETCGGKGTIDERLGGEWNSNPKATCPDCDGLGYWLENSREEVAE